jgi:hypothetical protein
MRLATTAILAAGAALAVQGPGARGQQGDDGCCPPTCKVCVREPKPTTRTVYGCVVQEYCLPRCCLLKLLGCGCGCGGGPCGDLMVRHRLVVRKVPGCDTWQCVLREVPVIVGPVASAPEAKRCRRWPFRRQPWKPAACPPEPSPGATGGPPSPP